MQHFSIGDRNTETLNALDEYAASCTVVIASERPEFAHGTGIAAIYGGQHYILTAAHVLKGEPDNQKIRIIGRPDGPLQLLRGKQELANAIVTGSHKAALSSATSVGITARVMGINREDIAALKVDNPKAVLPHTTFHDLSGQGRTRIAVGDFVSVYGFPEEIVHSCMHDGRRGRRALPYATQQTIKAITDVPATPDLTWDSKIDLIVDFDCPEDKCNPHGMSGCGAWSIPKSADTELWSAQKSQLLGIQVNAISRKPDGFKLLHFTRIECVLNLLLQ